MEEEADKVNTRCQSNPFTLSFVRQWKSQRNGGRTRVSRWTPQQLGVGVHTLSR